MAGAGATALPGFRILAASRAGNRSRVHQPSLPSNHSTRHGVGVSVVFFSRRGRILRSVQIGAKLRRTTLQLANHVVVRGVLCSARDRSLYGSFSGGVSGKNVGRNPQMRPTRRARRAIQPSDYHREYGKISRRYSAVSAVNLVFNSDSRKSRRLPCLRPRTWSPFRSEPCAASVLE